MRGAMPNSSSKIAPVAKVRPIKPTPKELAAWRAFEELIAATESVPGKVAPMVVAELNRLCEKAHPLALRLKEQLSVAEDRPRLQTEKPKEPPAPRQIKHVHWTHK